VWRTSPTNLPNASNDRLQVNSPLVACSLILMHLANFVDKFARDRFTQPDVFERGGHVFQFTKPSDALQLIRWNKELPSASDADPLGLNLRVSARLANELLHCITSITPRARYYSFFPWALEDYNDNERGTSKDRKRILGILVRERAMVLGAVLHHDGLPCDGGALGGSKPAKDLATNGKKSYELSRWQHLQAPEGQFGAAYKGSLINLGIFKTDGTDVEDEATIGTDELDQSVQAIEVKELSAIGKRLAESFAASIRRTKYVTENWSLKNTVTANVLKQFGARAGLCEISGKQASDLATLRSMFFAHEGFLTKGSHYRRRMSLLLLLECIGRAHAAGIAFSNSVFSDICYFREIVVDDEKLKSISIKIPAALHDVAERWRVYHIHNYLAVALQSFLVSIVRVIRDRPGGVARSSLFDGLLSSAINTQFKEIFGINLPKEFFELTPREMLAISGIALPKSLADIDACTFSLPIASPFSERNVENLLVNSKANDASGIALSAMLFYQVILRYPVAVAASFSNWYEQHVYDRYTDISVPGIIEFLQAEFGESWVDRSNREILDRVIWRFVVRQHQTMSYERGFGGSAPLFHVDDATIIGTNTDYTDPRADNARFGSALQILTDLGLVLWNPEEGYSRSPGGDEWLAAELKQEGRP
jgi:hypothetical protein